jgi:CheY-like chemotaxis protein
MDAETRSRLFEPFFTTKRPGQGNGLGLATVYSIVKQDGGTIDVQSDPGQGTRVIVRLPQVQEAAKELPPILQSVPMREEPETILLVEDNLAVRKSMRRVLVECGYRVLEAAGGAAALKVCQHHKTPIDLLLVDLVMPGMSGREVARQLRCSQPGLRVLYVSGYDQQRTGETNGEPIVLFRKPFTGRALVQKVREVLEESPRARSECQEKVTQS